MYREKINTITTQRNKNKKQIKRIRRNRKERKIKRKTTQNKCIIHIDKNEYYIGEPIYATLINTENHTIEIGTWEVRDEEDKTILHTEPPQIHIPPGTSYMIVWFQTNNNGEQVQKGKYRIIWKPKNNKECTTQYFEIK